MIIRVAWLLAACLACPSVQAATATMPAPAPAELAPAEAMAALPVVRPDTVIELELVDAVGSRTSRPDDFFALRVAADVSQDGRVVIPAGSAAVGQVVHAQKAGGGGKAGELILAARHVETPGGRIRLRSTFGAAGQHHTVASLVTAQFIGPFAMVVRGGEIVLAPGTRLVARTAAGPAPGAATPRTPTTVAPALAPAAAGSAPPATVSTTATAPDPEPKDP